MVTSKSQDIGKKKLKDHKSKVLMLLADFKGPTEIVDYFKSTHNIEVTLASITHYSNNYEDEIILLRETMMDRVLSIPIASKYYRIKLRQEMADDLIGNLWAEEPLVKRNAIIRDDENNIIMVKTKSYHTELNKILDSSKAEMEPYEVEADMDKNNINNNNWQINIQVINANEKTQLHIDKLKEINARSLPMPGNGSNGNGHGNGNGESS